MQETKIPVLVVILHITTYAAFTARKGAVPARRKSAFLCVLSSDLCLLSSETVRVSGSLRTISDHQQP